MMFAYIVAVISAVALTSAYPTGAPTSACFDMIPGHAAEVQKGPAPYTITSAVTAVKAGHSVDVVVSGKTPEDFFRGILLQARQGDKIVGTWTIPPTDKYSQLMDCGEPGNAVTHISRDDKHTLSYSWKAPEDLQGEVIFLVTIVKTYAEFWVKIPSATIQILSQH